MTKKELKIAAARMTKQVQCMQVMDINSKDIDKQRKALDLFHQLADELEGMTSLLENLGYHPVYHQGEIVRGLSTSYYTIEKGRDA